MSDAAVLLSVAERLRERFAVGQVSIVADRGIISPATMNREPSADILIRDDRSTEFKAQTEHSRLEAKRQEAWNGTDPLPRGCSNRSASE